MKMASSTTASTLRQQGVSLRKTNKPLMEKRRRARINDSLTQLKSLVIQGTKKDSSQFNKLEKADILELTVKYLRNLQTQQHQQIVNNSSAESAGASVGKYQDGFMECANEVIRYLGQSQGFSDDIKARVISHLASCIQLANLSKASSTTCVKPGVHVQPTSSILAAAPNASSQPTTVVGVQGQSAHQLPNGQIIQIVTSPYQTTPPSALRQQPPTTTPINQFSSISSISSPNTPVQVVSQQHQPPQQPAPLNHIVNTPSSAPSISPVQSQPQTLNRFAEPLHIQIPHQAFSPVRAQKRTVSVVPVQHQQDVPSLQQDTKTVAFPRSNATYQESPVERVPVPHQEVSTFPSPQSQSSHSTIPSPCFNKERPASPISYKQLSQSNHPACFEPRDLNGDSSRSRSYSMTSSSSVESDLASPVNLSRSPEDQHNEKQLTAYYRSLRKYPNPSEYKHLHSQGQRVSADRSPTEYFPTDSKFDSVIGDGKRTAMDGRHMHYMQMMHDDRQCSRDQGSRSRSTSPASSVGEERLWRPW